MKKNRYGNIEDIVKEVVLLTAGGSPKNGGGEEREEMWQHHEGGGMVAYGRVSCGVELKDLVIGSEGNLGIIASCICRVRPVATRFEFDSVLLHDFSDGVSFMRELKKVAGVNMPVSVRMVDNEQFRLAQVMKGGEGGGVVSGLKKLLVLRGYGFKVKSMVGVTLKYEGNEEEVRAQKRAVEKCVKACHGVQGGGEGGKAGYDLTFAIAYLRDFALTYGLVAER